MSKKPTKSKGAFRKEIKGPDAFQTKAMESLTLLEKNQKLFILVGFGLIGLALLAWGLNHWQSQNRAELEAKLGKIEKIQAEERERAETEREKLEKELSLLRAKLAEKPSEENAKSKESDTVSKQIEVLEQKVKDVRPDFKESKEALKAFYGSHPDTPQGFVAGFQYAAHLHKSGDLKGARAILTDIVKKTSELPLLQIQGRLALTSLLEDLKEFEEALKINEGLFGQVQKELKSRALMNKARILAALGKSSDASKTLDEILKSHAKTPEADLARSMKAILGKG